MMVGVAAGKWEGAAILNYNGDGVAIVRGECYISGGTVTVEANRVGTRDVCSNLDSACIHPDPAHYQENKEQVGPFFSCFSPSVPGCSTKKINNTVPTTPALW
jgi:hypothetical protein